MDFILLNATDFAIVGMLLAFFILAAVTLSGTALLVLVGMSLPIAGLLTIAFPYTQQLATILGTHTATAQLVIFILSTLVSVWVLRNTVGEGLGSSRPLTILGTAVALTALLISFSYHVVPIDTLYTFGDTLQMLFESDASFFWVMAGALFLFFIL